MNYGYGGDRIEHLLYRLQYQCIPKYVWLVIVHIGTNNMKYDSEEKIAAGIHQVCTIINKFRDDVDIIVSGILPRADISVKKVKRINRKLHDIFQGKRAAIIRTTYMKPKINDWTVLGKAGHLHPHPDLFQRDGIHLTAAGYDILVPYIQEVSLTLLMEEC